MKTTNPLLDQSMREITDCFGGADGGISFIKLQCLLERLDKQANEGDAAAEQILAVVVNFARLIKVASK